MSKKIHLSVSNPCHEQWDGMMPAARGRYCAACEKQVIDFTNMSDGQLADFFRKHSGVPVCGRLLHCQADRDITVPKKQIPWIKYFFQFTLPAFLISIKTNAQGNVKLLKQDTISRRQEVLMNGSNCSLIIQPPVNMIKSTLPLALTGRSTAELAMPDTKPPGLITDERTIRGKISDETGLPIASATVIIKGTNKGTLADIAGNFSLTPEKGWKTVVLIISAIGYESTEIKVDNKNPDVSAVMPVRLQMTVMGLIIPEKAARAKTAKPVPLLTQKLMDTAFKFFRIFPNPVASGASLHIDWKQTEEGYFLFDLLDLSGRKIYSKEIWIDKEARLLNLEVPSVTAGTYLLRVTNKESGKDFTEKIAIQ